MSGGSAQIRHCLDERDHPFDLARDTRAGLTAEQKYLPPKYFYDARGSELFDRITRLPEYYQTRIESGILRRTAPGLIAALRPRALVEYGSGSAVKTRVLLDAMRAEGLLHGYGPIDVSDRALRDAAQELLATYPDLRVKGVIADFEADMPLPFEGMPRLIAFLGSTIGNLDPAGQVAFANRVRRHMSAADGFLIGFDLTGDVARLERAYDDAEGITAEFNRNVLRVLNRELDADFDPQAFAHRAFYNAQRCRIEMHLVSREAQTVHIGALGLEVTFGPGESIHTENSYKFTRRSVDALLVSAGLRLTQWEVDPDGRFALALGRLT